MDAAWLELYTAPDSGKPYLEVTWGATRALCLYDPTRETVVDATWAAEHPEIAHDDALASCRIGGATFAAVPARLVNLSDENAPRTWPTPVVLGREIAIQHGIDLDTDHARFRIRKADA